MAISEFDPRIHARDVRVSDEALTVLLADGRTISVPLEWYPRLHRASPEQRGSWRLIRPGRRHSLARHRRGHQHDWSAGGLPVRRVHEGQGPLTRYPPLPSHTATAPLGRRS
jgi:hypothetical protein